MYRRKNTKLLFLSGIFILILLLLVFSNGFRNLFINIGKPVWNIKNSGTALVTNAQVLVRSKTDLLKENKNLNNKIQQLELEMRLEDVFKERAVELEKLLSIKSPNSVVSRVLSKPPYSPYDSFLLDKGSNDGVEPGDLVYSNGNFLIGSIKSVSTNTAKVELFSSPNRTMLVEIGNSISTEAEGYGGGNFIVKLPRELEIQVDNPVYYPNSNISIIGFVRAIESKPKDPFKLVYIKIPFNINEIKWVEIIK